MQRLDRVWSGFGHRFWGVVMYLFNWINLTTVECDTNCFRIVGIDRKTEKIYTSARKQMLISSLPPVITLHLKRFHQVSTSPLLLFIIDMRRSSLLDSVNFLLFLRPEWTYEKWTAMLIFPWFWILLHSAQHPARYATTIVMRKYSLN